MSQRKKESEAVREFKELTLEQKKRNTKATIHKIQLVLDDRLRKYEIWPKSFQRGFDVSAFLENIDKLYMIHHACMSEIAHISELWDLPELSDGIRLTFSGFRNIYEALIDSYVDKVEELQELKNASRVRIVYTNKLPMDTVNIDNEAISKDEVAIRAVKLAEEKEKDRKELQAVVDEMNNVKSLNFSDTEEFEERYKKNREFISKKVEEIVTKMDRGERVDYMGVRDPRILIEVHKQMFAKMLDDSKRQIAIMRKGITDLDNREKVDLATPGELHRLIQVNMKALDDFDFNAVEPINFSMKQAQKNLSEAEINLLQTVDTKQRGLLASLLELIRQALKKKVRTVDCQTNMNTRDIDNIQFNANLLLEAPSNDIKKEAAKLRIDNSAMNTNIQDLNARIGLLEERIVEKSIQYDNLRAENDKLSANLRMQNKTTISLQAQLMQYTQPNAQPGKDTTAVSSISPERLSSKPSPERTYFKELDELKQKLEEKNKAMESVKALANKIGAVSTIALILGDQVIVKKLADKVMSMMKELGQKPEVENDSQDSPSQSKPSTSPKNSTLYIEKKPSESPKKVEKKESEKSEKEVIIREIEVPKCSVYLAFSRIRSITINGKVSIAKKVTQGATQPSVSNQHKATQTVPNSTSSVKKTEQAAVSIDTKPKPSVKMATTRSNSNKPTLVPKLNPLQSPTATTYPSNSVVPTPTNIVNTTQNSVINSTNKNNSKPISQFENQLNTATFPSNTQSNTDRQYNILGNKSNIPVDVGQPENSAKNSQFTSGSREPKPLFPPQKGSQLSIQTQFGQYADPQRRQNLQESTPGALNQVLSDGQHLNVPSGNLEPKQPSHLQNYQSVDQSLNKQQQNAIGIVDHNQIAQGNKFTQGQVLAKTTSAAQPNPFSSSVVPQSKNPDLTPKAHQQAKPLPRPLQNLQSPTEDLIDEPTDPALGAPSLSQPFSYVPAQNTNTVHPQNGYSQQAKPTHAQSKSSGGASALLPAPYASLLSLLPSITLPKLYSDIERVINLWLKLSSSEVMCKKIFLSKTKGLILADEKETLSMAEANTVGRPNTPTRASSETPQNALAPWPRNGQSIIGMNDAKKHKLLQKKKSNAHDRTLPDLLHASPRTDSHRPHYNSVLDSDAQGLIQGSVSHPDDGEYNNSSVISSVQNYPDPTVPDSLNPLIPNRPLDDVFLHHLFDKISTPTIFNPRPAHLAAVGHATSQPSSFQVFKQRMHKFVSQHKECGPNCPHLLRFYQRFGLTFVPKQYMHKSSYILPVLDLGSRPATRDILDREQFLRDLQVKRKDEIKNTVKPVFL